MKKENIFFSGLRKVENALMVFEKAYAFITMMAMIFLICYQIVCRYWLFIATPMVEELVRYCFVTSCFVVGGLVVHNRDSVEMDLIGSVVNKYSSNPGETHKRINRIIDLTLIVFPIIVMYNYIPYVKTVYNRGQISPTLPVPMWVMFSFVAFGMALVAFHSLCLLILPEKKQDKAGVPEIEGGDAE